MLRDFAASDLPQVGQPASAEHLWKFIDTGLVPASLPDYAPHLRKELRERGGILLLDGLDEVPEADQRRTQIRQAVEDFKASFPRALSWSPVAPTPTRTRTGGCPASRRPFWRPSRPARCAASSTAGTPTSANQPPRSPQDAQGRAEVLKRAISAGDRLQALAERPLLLTLMASLHARAAAPCPRSARGAIRRRRRPAAGL
ncbi:MAG: hypothetical protein R2844_18195 [Caldilineales bacterium]